MILIWFNLYLALRFVSTRFLGSLLGVLHNSGNDTHWESWSTLKVMEHTQLGRGDFAGMSLHCLNNYMLLIMGRFDCFRLL